MTPDEYLTAARDARESGDMDRLRQIKSEYGPATHKMGLELKRKAFWLKREENNGIDAIRKYLYLDVIARVEAMDRDQRRVFIDDAVFVGADDAVRAAARAAYYGRDDDTLDEIMKRSSAMQRAICDLANFDAEHGDRMSDERRQEIYDIFKGANDDGDTHND